MFALRRYIRGLWCTNLGQYPRSAFGLTVGLIDGEAEPAAMRSTAGAGEGSVDVPASSPRPFRPYHDPDAPVESSWRRLLASHSQLAALDQPVASLSFYHALNPWNKVKLALTSSRALTSTFTYQLTDNVSVQSTFSTQLLSAIDDECIKNNEIAKKIARRMELFSELGYYQSKVNELRDEREKVSVETSSAQVLLD